MLQRFCIIDSLMYLKYILLKGLTLVLNFITLSVYVFSVHVFSVCVFLLEKLSGTLTFLTEQVCLINVDGFTLQYQSNNDIFFISFLLISGRVINRRENLLYFLPYIMLGYNDLGSMCQCVQCCFLSRFVCCLILITHNSFDIKVN